MASEDQLPEVMITRDDGPTFMRRSQDRLVGRRDGYIDTHGEGIVTIGYEKEL